MATKLGFRPGIAGELDVKADPARNAINRFSGLLFREIRNKLTGKTVRFAIKSLKYNSRKELHRVERRKGEKSVSK